MAGLQINKFLGLHLDSTGDTNLKPGELAECKNIRITEGYKARKREGYSELFASLGNHNIQGMWKGTLKGTEFFLFACNGHTYKHINGVNTSIGTLTDAKTDFFAFDDKVYILNGHEYKYFDGTIFGEVLGYRPKIAIGTPPSGGGTPYEGINNLTGTKHQTFSADGAATEYQLAETSINSIDFVKVNGVTKTITTDYTINLSTGKVTFTTAPGTGQDNVDIGWTKGNGYRAAIEKCRGSMLYSNRIFLWGNTEHKNRRYYSGLADKVPSAEYFPANNFSDVGSDEYEITDIVKQYNRQIIFKENDAYYSFLEVINDITTFPVFNLNNKGNVAFNQARLIKNTPYTVNEGIYKWSSTNIENETNATIESLRVQVALDKLNLKNAITHDYEAMGEYWLCIGKEVYIYSYRYDVWFYFLLNDTPTCFIEIDQKLYFGTNNGQIMKFGESGMQLTDNGTVINAKLETGFLDFGDNYRRKFLNFGWVGLQPESKSKCLIEWQSDYSSSSDAENISYNLADFVNVDYNNVSFDVNYNPQPFRLKLKAKKFTYFKLIITNDSAEETMTILNITLPAITGGMSK